MGLIEPAPAAALTPANRSYLQFNGCTNFSSKVTVAIPSVSGSSDATGRGSGMAGLIYSAALNAREAGALDHHPTCERTDGSACVITPNEVRQIMASGRIDIRFRAVSISVSPLAADDAEPEMLIVSADSRLAAISKDVRVRVEFSKNRLMTVRPRSDVSFGIPAPSAEETDGQ